MTEGAMVKNAADAEQVKSAKTKQISQRQLELNDLAWILSDVRGRRFIWRQFAFCKMNELSYSGAAHHQSDFNEGMKNVSQKTLADIMECRPEAYIEMLNENKREK